MFLNDLGLKSFCFEEVVDPSGGISRGDLSTPVSDFSIPDNYKEAKWAQNIKSSDDLWKQMNDAQGLIGKKSIPSHDSSDEEWADFYSKMRPESADKYEFSLPEGLEIDNDNEEVKAENEFIREMFHKYGLSQKQAAGLYQDYTAFKLGQNPSEEEIAAQKEEQDRDFEAKAKEAFGDKTKEVMKEASREFASLSEEAQGEMNGLSNESLIFIMNKINSTISKEDTMTSGEASTSGQSIDEIRSELANLRVSAEYKDPTHPDHKKTALKVEELREKMGKHYNR